MGSLLAFSVFGAKVQCTEQEFAIFDPLSSQTCATYLADYLSGIGPRTDLVNPEATAASRACEYRRGSGHLYTLNIKDYYYGWRDAAIVVTFALSSYAMVYLLMKLRTKASEKAQ